MNQSSSSDPVGQSADTNRTQITGCVDDSLRTRIAAAVIPEIPLLMLVVGAVVIWWRS